MMDSSLTSMSLKASNVLQRRGSGLGRRRLGQTLLIKPMINPGEAGQGSNKADTGFGTAEGSWTDKPVAAHHDHLYIHPKHFC